MAKIRPFKALRPQAGLAPKFASRPYDVLSSKEARVEAEGNPYSFYHVSKSEIDLPEDTDVHSQAVYDKAAENLQAYIRQDLLFQDSNPYYYIYQLIMNGRSQTGLVCVSAVSDYWDGIIKKHEFTRPEKEQDRINHIKTTGAQTGNVFLAYNNVADLDELIEAWKTAHQPIYDFVAEDGIQHSIWVVNDQSEVARISSLFEEKVPCTYIADGHHRAASAGLVYREMDAKGEVKQDDAPVNYFLTTIFPASQLAILDYNRVVKDLNGLNGADFLEKLGGKFNIEKADGAVSPAHLHEFGLFLPGQWYRLTAKEGTYTNDPIGILDVSILQNNVLDEILDIKDPRTDKRVDFVGGIRGLGELEKRVNNGDMAAAFSLHPVTIQQLFDIADSGEVMPPKSTWFEPKLRDGLLTHLI